MTAISSTSLKTDQLKTLGTLISTKRDKNTFSSLVTHMGETTNSFAILGGKLDDISCDRSRPHVQLVPPNREDDS
jgi:hypothetical protein